MKKWIVGVIVLLLGVGQLSLSSVVSANTLENIREQREETEEEIGSLESDLGKALEEISEVSAVLDELNEQIEEKEASIEEIEAEVAEQEAIVEARMDQARERLQVLQTSEVNQNVVLTLLEAESLTDLFNRTMAVIRLTDAGNQHIEMAQEEHDLLVELQDELAEAYAALEENVAEAADQKEELDSQVAELREMIQENESTLTQLVEREEEEVARIEAERQKQREEAERAARERAEQERAQEASAEETVSTSSSTSGSNDSSSSNRSNAGNQNNQSSQASEPAQPANNNQGGRSMTVQATGYSTQQASLSTHTATGIDLRQNPRVIAVDPSVIPLGSMVEVEGLGVYIAGDTGGAIRGNIIDIHFPTVQQALNWGRRSVNIRILD